MTSSKTLLYVADPMCSWCFGFAPVLAGLRRALKGDVGFRLVLGGLAPDDEQPMSEETKRYVQSAWRDVEARTVARFEWSYWEKCRPRRSTWPACRSVLAAEAARDGLGEAMFSAIQHAYYAQARDPSDREVLADLGAELGLERSAFLRSIDEPAMHAALAAELALRDRLGATGYPSVGVERDGELELVSRGWVELEPLLERLRSGGLAG